MDNDRDITFDIVIGHHYLEENSAFSKLSRCLPFSKWLTKHGIKKMGVKNSTLSDIIKILYVGR